ncbi:phosphoribosylglycinamide formyltransferase [Streptobacillus moniliformis]|uniref:Phosphoribosylglycinamide formyltransferase n=1 Tax=Streptobacillus moniliformis (strain ATCC 14647 / DSM 12112 / NCTC 10651 / 9901) TaxID=519441 RepID=D1AW73_STRM9|nr:formyltransferase family protein [Streptobacillus moniliformis]ACZ00549.1 formyl transferase domain protein [Streptobacillus moniliformis DSM 12112]AVL43033.1 phosphoribosylglycinamide formyltransferase [Streptobacillus moniliformis]QXW65316.1 phosphoribosylglycinamide formyltransferase [Streptobacillus moniliformis]SQA12804.1 Phosphoribosylglycinamide formyltransferase [Streptobacillus moniliformis]SQA14332.1 Phosphoribosylglycinamide formyltransferase [Streptobacillus moniliformis]
MSKIAVLVSGSGTNLRKILENNIDVAVIISDRKCLSEDIAKEYNIPYFELERKNISNKILDILNDIDVELIVLAGFLSIIKGDILDKYENRIINIHPSLIPKYSGVGMYGMRIHEKVFENKETISGTTIHYVTKGVDEGKIIRQEIVDVREAKSPEEIQKLILEREWEIYPKTIKEILEERK